MKSIYKKIEKKPWFAYLIIAFSAILFTTGIQMFIQVAHTLSSGLSALVIGPTLAFPILIPYTSIIYLLLNIPLIIIFWKGITKKFIIRTTYFLFIQAIFGALFLDENIKNYMRNLIVEYDSVFKQIWPIFIMSFIGSCIVGVSIALSWKYGASSGGGDIIVYYISTKKRKPVGSVKVFISSLFSLVAFVIVFSSRVDARTNAIPMIIGTFIFIGTTSWIINLLYPKYAKLKVEVHSKNIDLINNHLKKTYNHPWQINTTESGFRNSEVKVIETIMLLLEYKEFCIKIKKIDQNSWISATKVKYVNGFFDVKNVEK